MIPARLLPQRITYRVCEGEGSFGPSYGAPSQPTPARVQGQRKIVVTAGGDEVTSTAKVFLQPAEHPTVDDEVTLPDGSVVLVVARSDHVGKSRVELITVDVA